MGKKFLNTLSTSLSGTENNLKIFITLFVSNLTKRAKCLRLTSGYVKVTISIATDQVITRLQNIFTFDVMHNIETLRLNYQETESSLRAFLRTVKGARHNHFLFLRFDERNIDICTKEALSNNVGTSEIFSRFSFFCLVSSLYH